MSNPQLSNVPDTTKNNNFTTNIPSNQLAGPNFLLYKSWISGIQMQYPGNWHIAEYCGYPLPTSSEDNISYTDIVTFQPLRWSYEIPYSTVSASVENLIPNAMPSLAEALRDRLSSTSGTVVESNTNSTLAGYPAYSFVSSRVVNGTNLKSMEIGTIIGNKLYYITYESDDYGYYLLYVQKMIDSLKITHQPPLTSTKLMILTMPTR